jgi:glucose/arabinose dehydrogenase
MGICRPLIAALSTFAALVLGGQGLVDIEVTGHVLKPERVEATDERIGSLKLPPGFSISKFAEKLEKPRMLAVAEDGAVYVTRRESGDCLLLIDKDGDGRADEQKVVARHDGMHGIAIHGSKVYLVAVKEVFVADRLQDGTLGEPKRIISDLPDGGQHPNRTLAVGPDGMLYITIGSTCNECKETNKESATIVRAQLDGTGRELFTTGLRNTIGFAWHPVTKELWGMDHGIDWLGDEEQGEELNLLRAGERYGWPYVFGAGKFNLAEEPPAGLTHADWAKKSREPVLMYTPHASPLQMAFYTGAQFPGEFRNDAFITMRGSWNRKPPSGYEVVRLRFRDGKPVQFEPFLSGFLFEHTSGWAHFGRPVGLAVTPDGALLVGDDTNGVIYRISFERESSTSRSTHR